MRVRGKDITGNKYGRLTVLQATNERVSGSNAIVWLCKCDCGNYHKAGYSNLIRGSVLSCGCKLKEKMASIKNKYEDCGEYYKGTTNKGYEFLIDKEDFEKVCRYSWNPDGEGYLMATGKNNVSFKMHKLVLSGKFKVDHINHNVRDNRRQNLRECTTSQNAMNRKKPINNTSGVIGVSWSESRRKWCAMIRVNNKSVNLGRYKKLEDAVNVRVKAEELYFKEFRYKEVTYGEGTGN